MLALAPVFAVALLAQTAALSPSEQHLRDWITQHREEQVGYLARIVSIPSGTMNFAGVRRMADALRVTLDSLGFVTRWVPMDMVHRPGHLVAEHAGNAGSPRILLIGHLDTVFEGPGQGWQRDGADSIAKGAGSSDMKGGDVVMIYALTSLARAGELKDANIVVVFTGDEEKVGEPADLARRDLVEAGRHADVALAFESGSMRSAVIARRGSSSWRLEVTARQAHSSGVFRAGYGAIYEAARILNSFRERLAGIPNLTFNPGILAGGTEVTADTAAVNVTASGKSNIIAPHALATGDLRFITEGQKDSARAVMREIVAEHLAGTSATITFTDAYPAMPPTAAGERLIAQYSAISEALGYGPVVADDPGSRGAGDVSFIAPFVAAAMDGLGAGGSGSHSPEERVNLNSLLRQTERVTILIHRLVQMPAASSPLKP